MLITICKSCVKRTTAPLLQTIDQSRSEKFLTENAGGRRHSGLVQVSILLGLTDLKNRLAFIGLNAFSLPVTSRITSILVWNRFSSDNTGPKMKFLGNCVKK